MENKKVIMSKYPVKIIYNSEDGFYYANLFNWFCGLKSKSKETLLNDVSNALAVTIDFLKKEGANISPIDISELDFEDIYYVEPNFLILKGKIMDKWDKLKQKFITINKYREMLDDSGILTKKYQYIAIKCLSEKKLLSFEKKYKIKIPEDYRNFLKLFGNGISRSMKKYFIIEKLNNSDSLHEISSKYDKRTAFRKLKKKFPYCNQNIDNNWDVFLKLGYNIEYDSKKSKKIDSLQGALFISDEGCGNFYFMEVTGDNPGRIWLRDSDDEITISPAFDNFYDFIKFKFDEELEHYQEKYGDII
ncbi:MAG: SMI1/KNR4 family protein [Cyanobacteriota bacterium]